MDPAERSALHQRLAGLLPSQLDELALSLGMPPGHQPPRELNKADRAHQFLQWAEQSPDRLAQAQAAIDAMSRPAPRSSSPSKSLAFNEREEEVARTSKPQPPAGPPKLLAPLSKAQATVQERINEGKELLTIQPRSERELKDLQEKRRVWSDFNNTMLANMFTSNEVSANYSYWGVGLISLHQRSLAELVGEEREYIEERLIRLRSILEQLPLYASAAPEKATPAVRSAQGNSVFLVHGRNAAVKDQVARAIERLKVPLTILHEQPDKGRTIIEKFEEHAAEVDFAVVLLTGDDHGAGPDSPDSLKPRARQNVVFELGFFYGKLGRKRVCALYEVGVEIPSELSGILFILLDVDGAWRFSLAREMKSAGLDIDMNLAM